MLEENKTNNEKTTEYKVNDEEGKQHVERIVKNKESGEIKSHTVDGKEVEKPKKPVVLQYTPSNADFIQIKLMEMIVNQLKEMNYYLRKQTKEVINDDEVREAIKNG